jgi:hypothetical protein
MVVSFPEGAGRSVVGRPWPSSIAFIAEMPCIVASTVVTVVAIVTVVTVVTIVTVIIIAVVVI